jgi:ABC-type cobalamin/Fe3+-siderophores transport system ATPase subunit
MELIADEVTVAGVHGPLLLPTSLRATPRHVTVVAGDPGHGHVALALALGGRAPLSGGSVTLDGSSAATDLRRHVALVDVPDVTSPEDALPVRAVVAEQLALAGRPSSRAATRAFLRGRLGEDLAKERFEALSPHERTTLLMQVAASRAATRVLVIAEPDRWGGEPHRWWRAAEDLAVQGLTVVVQCTHATARDLGQTIHHELGVAA